MLDASTSRQVSRSVESRAKLWRNCCIDAVTALRTPRGEPPFAGKKVLRDLFLTMAALCQHDHVAFVRDCPSLSYDWTRAEPNKGAENGAIASDSASPSLGDGKQEVSGQAPTSAWTFWLCRAVFGPHALGHVRRSARYPHRLARQSRPALSSIATIALPSPSSTASRSRTQQTAKTRSPSSRSSTARRRSRIAPAPHSMRKRQPAED